MKIVFLGRYNTTDFLTGPEIVAKCVYRELYKYNLEISFIEYFFDGSKYPVSKKLFGIEKTIDGNVTILRMGLLPIFFYLIRSKPDVIHCITFERFQVLAFIYQIFSKSKIIYNVNGIIAYENSRLRNNLGTFYKWKDSLVEKIIFKHADILLFLSRRSMEIAGNYYKINKVKSIIVPNGFDPGILKLIHSIEYLSEKLSIVFVGDSDRPEKGLDFLITSLQESNIPVKLSVLGDKDYLAKINNNLEIEYKMKMSNQNFIKFLSDKLVFVSASFYEQFSISSLEALAMGLVVVLTENTGLSELLTDGKDAFIFKYGDKLQLIDIIQKIYDDRKLIDKIKTVSRRKAESLTWTNITKNYYLPLYKNICVSNENIDTYK
jgi:glycosyltransferase involved in cell wall biosynthesis